MNKLLIFLNLIIICFTSIAQNGGFLDTSFGNGGKVVTSITPGEDEARSVAVQPDGKILVAGFSSSVITDRDFACVRYMPNGDLDSTFGTNGIVTTDVQVGSQDVANSMVLLNSGKFILAGYSDDGLDAQATMIRYNTDGSIDSSFGTNGIVLTDFFTNDFDQINVIKVHELTGNIIVGGHAYYDYTYFTHSADLYAPVIARYLPDGTPDSTFNNTGINVLYYETAGTYDVSYDINDLAIAPNGRITAVGWRLFEQYYYNSDYWVLRLNNDGTYDTSFGDNGEDAFYGNFNQHDYAQSIILNIDNSFVIGGGSFDSRTTEIDMVCHKINSNGTGFLWSGGGAIATDDSREVSYALLQDASNRYIMVGSLVSTNSSSFALARVNSNGSDDSFGPGQNFSITTSFNQGNSQAFDGALQSDGKIIAVGYAGNDFAIARYWGGDGPMIMSAPDQTAPNNNAADYALAMDNFSWAPVPSAVNYELAISTYPSMLSPQVFNTTDTFQNVSLLAGSSYYWQVRASNGVDNSPWSNVRTFYEINLDSFSLSSPAHQSQDLDPSATGLNWSNVTGNFPNVSYRLAVGTDPTLSSALTLSDTISVTNYQLTTLNPNTTYYWSVTAMRGNETSDPSDIFSFKTGEPTTGISQTELSQIDLYPNPVNDKLNIHLGNNISSGVVSVSNILGQQVIESPFNNTSELVLDMNIEPGIYLVTVRSEGVSITQKIWKR